jgi:hypothetical protein
LVVATEATLHVGLFSWIEPAARRLDERKRTAHLPIANRYTLAAVAALRSLLSLGLA